MRKIIVACATITVAVSAGVSLYKYWQKRGGDKTSSSDDEVSRTKLLEDCAGKVTPFKTRVRTTARVLHGKE